MSQDSSAAPTPPPPFPLIPWTKGIAPRFIAVFLLLVFLDRLALRTLLVGGLMPSVVGAVLGGLLAFLLFFRPLALWGLRAREPIERLATRTFGSAGSVLVPRLILSLVLIVWYAVVIREAVDATMRALNALGLLDSRHLQAQPVGGVHVPSPLFLWVAALWSLTSALIGAVAYKLVAAVMAGYQPFVALMLAGLVGWALPTTPGFAPLGYDPFTGAEPASAPLAAGLQMIQWVCAYFATVAAVGADWGMASRDPRDVRDGGMAGIALAAPVLATLALLFVAGTLGRPELSPHTAQAWSAQQDYREALLGESQVSSVERYRHAAIQAGGDAFTVRALIQNELPGWRAGLCLMIFAVGLLGPACFTPYLAGRLISGCWPKRPRWIWTLAAATASWPLLALDLGADLGRVLDVLGALVAPMLGAMAADRFRARGAWPGPRPGYDLGAIAACLLGTGVGLAPIIGPRIGLAIAAQLQPSILFAYLVSFAIVLVLPRRMVGPARGNAASGEGAAHEPQRISLE